MEQKDKELLIKDLSGRIPYRNNFWLQVREFDEDAPSNRRMQTKYIDDIYTGWVVECKPYLRPISSMTENEYNELKKISSDYGLAPFEDIHNWAPNYNLIDWLNRKMFDYRGLIQKGLAFKAIKGMYKN